MFCQSGLVLLPAPGCSPALLSRAVAHAVSGGSALACPACGSVSGGCPGGVAAWFAGVWSFFPEGSSGCSAFQQAVCPSCGAPFLPSS